MKGQKILFSSNSEEWATPQGFYDQLNAEFHFDLDPCASKNNYKCKKYFTKEENGLDQRWQGHRVFCNPPYGKHIKDWVKKALSESKKPNTLVVMLLPVRTDTAYFHDYILNNAEIRFIRGRLKFGGSSNSAPFPSMIVVFKKK